MKYLLLLSFHCVAFLQNYFIVATDITLNQFYEYEMRTEKMNINNKEQEVKLYWHTETNNYVYKLLNRTNKTTFQQDMIKQLKQYENGAYARLEQEVEVEKIPFYFQVLIWNVECFNKEANELVFYQVESESINNIYQEIIHQLFFLDVSKELSVDEAKVEHNYDNYLRNVGPYYLEDLSEMSEIGYQHLRLKSEVWQVESEGIIKKDKGLSILSDDFSNHEEKLCFFKEYYEIIESEIEGEENYFEFTQGMKEQVSEIAIIMPELFGTLQIQVLTSEHQPMKNTTYHLLNMHNDVIKRGTVNEAATEKITQLIPGFYMLVYEPQDNQYPRKRETEIFEVIPNKLTKKIETIDKIMGEVQLNFKVNNKKGVEVYKIEQEKKQFLYHVNIENQNSYKITQLETGEYYIKFLMDSYDMKSEDIHFFIDQDIQYLTYDVKEQNHELLVATGTYNLERIVLAIFLLSLSIIFVIIKKEQEILLYTQLR